MDDKTQAAEVRAAFEKSLASNTGSAQAFRRALASTASAFDRVLAGTVNNRDRGQK